MPIELAEFNTIITFLGMTCAVVQGATGYYAAYYLAKPFLLRANPVLFRAHTSFGGFATTLYLLGLFMGLNSIVGAFRINEPPLELGSVSFNVHTWGSFPVMIIFLWKTLHSYFHKAPLYSKRKWLGPALFLAWCFNWITAAISYYQRTLPANPQHSPPSYLLPYELVAFQIIMPFAVGALIAWPILSASRKHGPGKGQQKPGSREKEKV